MTLWRPSTDSPSYEKNIGECTFTPLKLINGKNPGLHGPFQAWTGLSLVPRSIGPFPPFFNGSFCLFLLNFVQRGPCGRYFAAQKNTSDFQHFLYFCLFWFEHKIDIFLYSFCPLNIKPAQAGLGFKKKKNDLLWQVDYYIPTDDEAVVVGIVFNVPDKMETIERLYLLCYRVNHTSTTAPNRPISIVEKKVSR